jgi:hypothetical protein
VAIRYSGKRERESDKSSLSPLTLPSGYP